MRRSLFIAAATLSIGLASCSAPKPPEPPPAENAAPQLVEADAHTRNALLTALTPVIEQDLVQKVSFRVDLARTMGDWGWVAATPLTLDGKPIDFTKTHYAEQQKEGMLDGDGAIHALLQNVDGAWTVKAFALGPTDLAWAGWPQEYGAPPEVMGLESGEGAE